MKKTLSLMLVTGMLLGLVGCGSGGGETPSDSPAPAEVTPAADNTTTADNTAAPSADNSADDGKVHITYCF